jgi:opacity protein-like surface antigen
MRKFLAVASIALAVSSQAFAADLAMPDQSVAPPPVEQAAVSSSTGWYLRGDLSADLNRLKGADYFQGSNKTLADFNQAELRNSYNVGVGAGYQIDDHFRVDSTFDYMFDAAFRGSTSGTCGVGGKCVSRDVSGLTAYSLMANAYVDIATWGMLTPYVGIGIGGTDIKWDDLHNTSCSASNPNNCDTTVIHKGRESWRFTYALMAGTSVDINCNLKADVGYRYRHIAAGDMFGYRLHGGPGYDKGLDIHEFRTGLRYSFGGCDQQAYLPPVEIPQQQPVFK